jgi:hypothetical protein
MIMDLSHYEYLDFIIEMRENDNGTFTISVVHSPAGEASEVAVFPFGNLELDNHLQALEIALLRSGGQRRKFLSKEENQVQTFGSELFKFAFPGEIRTLYAVSQEKAKESGKGLRIKLRINSPRLAALPWEYFYNPRDDDYISLSRNNPVVRYIDLQRTIEPLSVTPPLNVLGMVVSPKDIAQLNVDDEKRRIEQALKSLVETGKVSLTWLEGQTWRHLQRSMRQGPWHIFHFIGHGGFEDEGLLALANEEGKSEHRKATDIATLLRDHHSLRLVILNSCEGARGSNLDAFSSTASILVRKGIPAVLGMQYEITDGAAIEFSSSFYEAMAEGLPIDAALSEARKAISISITNSLEWGIPVLYMRSPNGELFSYDKHLSIEHRTVGSFFDTTNEKDQEAIDQKRENQSLDDAYNDAEVAAAEARARFEELAAITKERAEELQRKGQVVLEE